MHFLLSFYVPLFKRKHLHKVLSHLKATMNPSVYTVCVIVELYGELAQLAVLRAVGIDIATCLHLLHCRQHPSVALELQLDDIQPPTRRDNHVYSPCRHTHLLLHTEIQGIENHTQQKLEMALKHLVPLIVVGGCCYELRQTQHGRIHIPSLHCRSHATKNA